MYAVVPTIDADVAIGPPVESVHLGFRSEAFDTASVESVVAEVRVTSWRKVGQSWEDGAAAAIGVGATSPMPTTPVATRVVAKTSAIARPRLDLMTEAAATMLAATPSRLRAGALTRAHSCV